MKNVKTPRKTKQKFIDAATIFEYFDEYINDSYSGSRRKKNGKPLQPGSVAMYRNVKRTLENFVETTQFDFKIYIDQHLTIQEKIKARKYYSKFYLKLTWYMYDKLNFYDNYAGSIIRGIRAFFNYLEAERYISVGIYHRSFFVYREEISIVALTPEQLKYVIYDLEFDELAAQHNLSHVKDLFVIGCTIALRISDLLSLTRKNLFIEKGKSYIKIKSIKTETPTTIKLPEYAKEIILKYADNSDRLLPSISMQYFNEKLKQFARLLPDDFEFIKTREKRGKTHIIYKDPKLKTHYKLSDHISTHTMRRTAISTMLSLNMPEHIVRKISGHAAHSREFFRYVQISQSVIDKETDEMFERLREFKEG
jgi:integrase